MEHEIFGVFPNPVYFAYRDSEEVDIEDIIKEGMQIHEGSSTAQSNNMNIFDTKLKELKEFIEGHIKIYVREVLNPKEENELDFYITESWLNIVHPGGQHNRHCHQNSIISGVFYIATTEDDFINFYEPLPMKHQIKIEELGHNLWNAYSWYFPVTNNKLILFPSWLDHGVEVNGRQTTDRISLAFNVFVRGKLGEPGNANKLILK